MRRGGPGGLVALVAGKGRFKRVWTSCVHGVFDVLGLSWGDCYLSAIAY
jgi:hypothetical protein